MLKNISWTNYIVAVAIALAVYYVFVAVRYYSGELKDLLAGKRKPKLRSAPVALSEQHSSDEDESIQAATGFENTTDDEFTEVEHLIGRLRSVIEDAARRKLIPQEFKQYLGMVLKEYPSVKYSPLRSSVNELIISECQKYGTIALGESDVEVLWKEVAV